MGLINSISNLYNIKKSKKTLAIDSIDVEQRIMKENCGSQDQIWAAYGGFNYIKFNKTGSFSVNKIKISDSNLFKLNNNFF